MMTGTMATFARPYALAAFETALQHDALPAWEAMLTNARMIVQHESVMRLLNSPEVKSTELAALFCDVLSSSIFSPEMNHFIRLLAENKRLPVLPDITELFIAYRMEHEKMIQVKLISAVPVTSAQQQDIIQKLTKRLQKRVLLTTEVDASLLGGAIIKANDRVIDGSVRGKLNRLLESL